MYIVYRSVTRWNSAGVPSCQRLSFLFCASKQTAISKPFCTWRCTWRMLLALPFSMLNSIWCSKKFCIVCVLLPSLLTPCKRVVWSLLHAVHFFIEPSFAETKGSLCRCGVKLGCGEHFRWWIVVSLCFTWFRMFSSVTLLCRQGWATHRATRRTLPLLLEAHRAAKTRPFLTT